MNKLINEAQKIGIDVEVFVNKNDVTTINTLNDTLKLFQISNVKRYIVKAMKDNKCIKLSCENINNVKELISSIEEILSVQENTNDNTFCKGNVSLVNEFKGNIDYEVIKKDLLSLNDLKNEYPSIKAIEVSFEHAETYDGIKNKVNNASMEQGDYLNSYGVSITLEKDGETKVVYASYFDKEYNFDEFKKYLKKKIETSLIKFGSKSIETNKYKVILMNNVVTDILTTFVDSFSSKNIAFKNSVLTGKFNEKVFSDKISIIEDSLNGVVKEAFDSEGTLKKYQEIVKNGVFVKEINDLEYALKNNLEPTGNAGSINNLYLETGNLSFEELLEKLDNGIIISDVFGLHSGIDKKTGNISVQAEGFEVRDGKIVGGLNMIILASNIFEVFSNVLEVGNDLTKESISVLVPSILLENITITGKE